MPRLVITVSDRMDRVLKEESSKTGAPVAAIIRKAIEEWARRQKIEAPDDITWGGVRKSEDSEEGQSVAVGAP